jgi:predicted Fe-Mo cluster-binding NifX family protein
MKIAIPVNEKALTTEVSPVLARAYFIAVYDTTTDQITYNDNIAKNEQGGAGVKAGQLILDLGCDTVITFRCGDNAGKIFQAAGMKILTAIAGTVETNIEAAVAGNLVELAGFHSGFHGNAPEDLQVVGNTVPTAANSVVGVRGICDGTRKSAPRGTGLGRRCLTGVGLGRGAGRGAGCGIGRGRGAGRGLGLRDGSGRTTGTGRRMGFGDNK